MESNNHFNYGTHSSANSGLKLSSGDSLYANGSSASFSQQGKNINGEINVNGTTTVLGSGVPGSLPPTAPYPRMSSHQQSSRGYEYLWGGHPQYGPSMGTSAGHGLHQKQPAAGMAQPQSQHHFQGHGQYQLNGSVEGSHQPPLAGPPNVPLPGNQFWNRSNPGPQQVGYSIYGSYQSQTQHGITPPHHQQSSHPTLHQPSQQHLQSHRSPHHHQQHQQPQHYGVIPNGMPLYQHQPPHLNMSSQQQQQPPPPPQSQTQSQCQLIPAADQSFTSPHGSPQHHSSGRAATGSPLPEGISSTVMAQPKGLDGESPKIQNRDGKKPSVIQGNTKDYVNEDDTSYNGSEKAAIAHRLPKMDGPSPKPPAAYVGSSSDFKQNSDQSAAQSPEMVSSIKDAALNPPHGFASSQLSKSSSPGPGSVSLTPTSPPAVSSSHSQMSVSFNVSSVQSPSSPSRRSSPGLGPLPSEVAPAGPKNPSARPPSSILPTSPPKLSMPLSLSASEPRPASSSHPAVVSSSESVIRHSPLPPGTSTALSASAPITSLQQMVHGAYMSHNSISSSTQHNRPHPPKLISTIASLAHSNPSAGLVHSSSSTAAAATPSIEHKPSAPMLMSHFQTRTPPPLRSGLSPAAPALLSDVSSPSAAAHIGPKVQPLPTLPLLNTQASRTALLSTPHALMSLPPGRGLSSQLVQHSSSQQHLPNTSACVKLPPNPECYTVGEERKVLANNRTEKAEEQHHHPQSISKPPQEVEMTESPDSGVLCHRSISDLPGKPFQTTASSDPAASTKQEEYEKQHTQSSAAVIRETEDSEVEPSTIRKLSQFHSSRVEHLTEHSSTPSRPAASQPDNGHSPPKAEASSVHDDKSIMDGDSSWVTDSDASFQLRNETSEYHSSYCTKGETSTAFDTTRDSNPLTEDSRDDTLDSTRGEGSSEDEETEVSHRTEGESTMSCSFNSSAQMEEPSVDASDGSKSGLYEPSHLGHPEPRPDWETRVPETPDVAGRRHVKAPADESSPLPIFNMRDENFTFSTPVDSRGLQPIPPVTDQTVSAAEEQQAPVGKPRKRRASKTLWTKTPVPEQAQRKPRGRTPRVEKVSSEVERPTGTKRRKSFRVEAADKSSDEPGEAGAQTKEMDSITATIEAVLASAAAVTPAYPRIKKVKRVKKEEQDGNVQKAEDAEENDDGSATGDTNRRRVATEEQVQFALLHGWKREIRVKKKENRMKGETWYYTPCGRRMKQFPEILKYLKKHTDSVVTRENFSFSPRMPVGDFYEERETAEGMKWFILANEEVPSMIMAITGRRGRPPNPDKEKPRRVRGVRGGEVRRPGRPPKTKMIDLLTKVDAKLLQRLEAKEALTEEEKEKLAKIKKKMKKKARIKRREDTKIKKMKEEKKRARIKIKLEQDAKVLEAKADSTTPTSPRATLPAPEPKKPGRRRSVKVEPPPVEQTDEERIAQGKRVLGARSKAKALAKAQAEAEAAAEAAARAALSAKRAAERRAQAQKRMEERKRQQLIAEELKKPTEDMCLTDHKPLPELSRIPGVVLSGAAFSHCLAVVEFLHGYGKLLGLNVPKDIPSLSTLQEGLLGLGDGQGEVQDLLIKLVEAALHDPGLPSYYQSVKILGEKLVDLELTRSTVSEPLRIFLESHGYETEVCNTLRTKTFHSLPPDTKAAILGFLVDELNGSNAVTSDIDNTLENMATYRKNKWIIEGKLRRLKAALARRTGRSEEELCFEERRRSARVAEEENLSLEEGGSERGSRRARKEEPKLTDIESPAHASIPELERQIDKLTKRQTFFRKKLQQSSQSMRAILLGQDRYQRRYTAFPHLGGVLVEGPEELLASGDVLIAEVPVTFLKKEPKVEDVPMPTTASPPASPPALPCSPVSTSATENQTLSPEVDPLPGTASLMSRPRGRGRPRKIKPEVELHLRTAKSRRRRRSSVRSGSDEGPGSPNICPQDLTQTAFQSWLSQTQETLANGTCPAAEAAPEGSGPEESKKELAEKQGQWFNVLPKQPCDNVSITELPSPSSTLKLQPTDPPSSPAPPPQQQDLPLPDLVPSDPVIPATPPDIPPTTVDSVVPVTTSPQSPPPPSPPPPALLSPTPPALPPPPPPPPPPPSLPPPLLPPPSLPLLQPLAAPIPSAPVAPNTPTRPGRRRRRGSRGSSPARRGARGAAAKRRGRPPGAVFQELEQQYFTQLVVKPIPASMVRGWWWIKDPEELYYTLQALHPRGVRERVLHKHLAKHMESLTEMCSKSIDDPIFEMKVEQKDTLMEALQQPWLAQEKAMETDVCALQWVEDLEQRVVGADLQLKAPPQSTNGEADANIEAAIAEFQPYTIPDPDSSRDDLQYYEHDADPRDDWILRTKKEWSGLPRIATHPLDLGVLRLANLERNIERRYLKEPLWNPAEVMRLAPLTPTPGDEQPLDALSLESEITSRLRTWRQALDRCRSAPQLCLCLLQLEKAIAWERSVTKVTCQICRKGDNDDCLLLCDGCDRGCHMYCLRPKLTQVPEGDWFCATCVAREEGQFERLSKTRTRMKKRKKYDESSSEEEPATRRTSGMSTRNKDVAPSSSSSSLRPATESSATKRRRMATRNLPDLTFCEIILMEMEAHADAWPFLEPVNPRLVPGYRRIIKNPMDFLTMRERLLQGGYSSCDEFAADAQLVFNNCELFNEDTSDVGMAGHSMRRFFESRWAEFYSKKDK